MSGPMPGTPTPRDADLAADSEPVAGELRRYANLVDDAPSPGFADRVMAAVEASPAPRRGPVPWLAGLVAPFAGPAQRSLRMAAIAAVVIVAVGGALIGSELSGLLRNGPPAGSSTSPFVSPTIRVTASPSPSPSPSGTPETTDSADPTPTVAPTKSPDASPSEREDHGGSQTPQPTETPEPTASAGEDH